MSSEPNHESSIFNTARQIQSGDERGAYLSQACGGDSVLKQRVEQLLAAHRDESGFLEQPAPGLKGTVLMDSARNKLAASLDAGLATAFEAEAAVVIGDVNHSVLRSLGNTIADVPRVMLRQSDAERVDPIAWPTSPEIPKSDSDSRYRLDGEIARGGMGAILKGRDTDLGRDLAIKVLLDSHKDKPDVIQRFIEEAQIGGQLQHPGIAPVYELGQFSDNRPFFSMKLVKGQTLSKLLADREDAVGERGRFIGIFEQVCQTVAYAHSRGVIHRDLKPANIMVGAFGEVQVMDWGLAKVLSSGGVADEKKSRQSQQGQSVIQTLRSGVGSDPPGAIGSLDSRTQMGSVMGTPAYMPPEQALGEIDNLDERADVFGLGAILAEILTGRPPYVGTDGTAVFRQASRGKLDDCMASLDACGADDDLITLTKHCLELEPVNRPRDAGVLAARVTHYLESVETKLRESETEAAVQNERLVQQQQSARKLRKLIAGLTAVSLITIGMSLVAGRFWTDAREEAIRANEQREIAQTNLAKADRAEKNAIVERNAAQEARLDAIDQTYLATINEIRSMRLARQSGWRSAVIDRLQSLVKLGSRNLDRAELRTEAIACLTEMDVRIQSKLEDTSDAWRMEYSSNGQMLAVSSLRQVSLYDMSTKQKIRSLPKSFNLSPFAFHRSGTLAIASMMGRVTFHPLGDTQVSFPEIVGEGHALNLAFDRSGDHLAIVWGDVAPDSEEGFPSAIRQAVVYEMATGAALWRSDFPAQTCLNYKTGLALSPDGQSLATIGLAGEVRLFSLSKKDEPIVLGNVGSPVSAIKFHPDGQSLVAAGRSRGVVWNLKNNEELIRVHATEDQFWDVAFSPDGQLLVAIMNDNFARLWDSRSGRELAAIPTETNDGLSIAFSPNGDQFTAGGGAASIIQIDGRGVCRTDRSTYVRQFAFEKTRAALFYIGHDNSFRFWNLNEPVASVVRRVDRSARGYPSVMRMAPDGQHVAVGVGRYVNRPNDDFSISVLQIDESPGERRLVGPQQPLIDIAFDPTGHLLAASSEDGALFLWEFETSVLLKRLEMPGIGPILFLDESQLLVAAGNRLMLIEAADGAVSGEVTFSSRPAAVVVSLDHSKAFVLTSDGTIHRVRISDLMIEQSRLVLEHPSNLLMAVSPDSRLLAVSTQAGLRNFLIATNTLETLARLPDHDRQVTCIEFDQRGGYLALGGAFVNVWDLALIQSELMRLGLDLGEHKPSEVMSLFIEATDRARGRAAKASIINAAAALKGVLEPLAEHAQNDGEFQAALAEHYADQGNATLADSARVKARQWIEVKLAQEPENPTWATELAQLLLEVEPSANERQTKLGRQATDPWERLAAAYFLVGDQPAIDRLLEQHPASLVVIGDMHAAVDEWEQAIVTYSRLIGPEATDAGLLLKRAVVYSAMDEWELAKADWLRAIELQPIRLQQAFDTFCGAERWSDALEFGRMLIEQNRDDSILWLRNALILAVAGNDADYAEFCRRFAQQFVDSQRVEDVERVIKGSLLRAAGLDFAELPLARLAITLDEGTGPPWFPVWGWGTRALLAYRSGDADSAVEYVNKSESLNPGAITHAFNLVIEALAQHQLQHVDKSQNAFKEAAQLIARLQAELDNQGGHDLQIAAILLREAEMKLDGNRSTIPPGGADAL